MHSLVRLMGGIMFIDARGLGCPKPVLLAEDELSKITEGIVEILVDNEASVQNLSKFASKNGIYSEIEKVDNYWKVKLVKGYPCEIDVGATLVVAHDNQRAGTSPAPTGADIVHDKKDIFLIIGTDTMGKEEKLGKILMKGFFETMKVTKEIPHTLFFLNAGVKLTTVESEIFPLLKDIEEMGVEIYSCGTCLKHYDLEHELKVGHRGTTNHIVEGIKDFKKIVWV
ncbi:MAG: sulfurtransferase-like selenium metabolism protein YedF [Nitrospirae bacterium]|nr:sulfurtransferase-like selenium metabolism protein YedF [Nitrospirota bacterium]